MLLILDEPTGDTIALDEGAVDPVEQRHGVRRTRVEVIDGTAQQRAGQGPIVDVDPSGEARELGRVFTVDGDVQALATQPASVHATTRSVLLQVGRQCECWRCDSRPAIAVRIEQRRNDDEVRARLRRSIADNQKILDRLAR